VVAIVERTVIATNWVDQLETGWRDRHFRRPGRPKRTKNTTLPR
jgi:hypothetical protein